MIRDNQKVFNRLQVLLDAVTIVASYILAWYIKFYVFDAMFHADGIGESVGVLSWEEYFKALIFIVPVYLILYYYSKVYTPKRTAKRRYEVFAIIQANTIGLLLYMVLLYATKQMHISRAMMILFFAFNVFLTTLIRTLIRNILSAFRKKGYNLKHIFLVGYSRAGEEYIDRILGNPQWGYVVLGILDDSVPKDAVYRGIKVVGKVDELSRFLQENRLDEIAITLSLKDYHMLTEIVGICEKSGIHIKFIPDYNNLIPSRPYTEDLMGLPVINIRYVPLTNTGNMIVKRAVDVIGALAGILLTSPLMLLSVVLIKMTSFGPVIFKQERVGLHNRPFYMYKFRSMEMQKPSEEKKAWTVKDDPRVTKVGKILRKTSIDELPQLFNILKGDMSLVGPRPERPLFVEKFKEEIPRYMVKHQVRPGLTGWAQINGYRGDTSIKRRVEYDLYYIENWSLGLDIKIIFLTFFTGFINKNAY